MCERESMKRFLRNNGLSIVMGGLFLFFWAGQAVSGYLASNQNADLHGDRQGDFAEYLASGHFWQATGENWESEFLQMGAYVIFTAFLFQKGSAESLDPDGNESKPRRRSSAGWLYRNSLSLAFFGLFAGAFTIHALGGLAEFNEEMTRHGRAPVKSSIWTAIIPEPRNS